MPCHKSYGSTARKETIVRCKNEHPKGVSLEVRNDLIDTEISICTVEVFDHFKDNHDKTLFKDDYIQWMQNTEIIEDRVRAFEVQQQGAYAARIANPRMYGAISRDIL